MSTHLLALYVAAVFLAMIAPGPDMMFILATGMRGGPRAGLVSGQERASACGSEQPGSADRTISRKYKRQLLEK